MFGLPDSTTHVYIYMYMHTYTNYMCTNHINYVQYKLLLAGIQRGVLRTWGWLSRCSVLWLVLGPSDVGLYSHDPD